jgi:hypothetical protein
MNVHKKQMDQILTWIKEPPMLTKREQKFMQIEELHKLLEDHDFYYVYSDDHRAYEKGRESQDKIEALIKTIGPEGKKLYEQFASMQ